MLNNAKKKRIGEGLRSNLYPAHQYLSTPRDAMSSCRKITSAHVRPFSFIHGPNQSVPAVKTSHSSIG